MNDVKKLLARIGAARDAISRKEEQTGLDFMIDGVLMNCAVMLKEQEEQIENLKQTAQSMIEGVCLLKEQEAVEPIPYHRSDGTIFKYECRKCRTKIFKMDLFCRHCGQAVKWNEQN